MRCKECYSDNPRITPLKGAKDCLAKHRQYICSLCGRAVCIDLKGEKRARCFYPFSSLQNAILYLKPAEIITGNVCGIYELIYKRGEKRYKIFRSQNEFEMFLNKNTGVKCTNKEPVCISEKYNAVKESQIKYLNESEVLMYLSEMKK